MLGFGADERENFCREFGADEKENFCWEFGADEKENFCREFRADERKKQEKPGMRIGICSTDFAPSSIEELFKKASFYGFRAMQFSYVSNRLSES